MSDHREAFERARERARERNSMHNDNSFDGFFKFAGCTIIGVYLLICLISVGVLGGLGWLAWQLIQRL